MVKCKRCGRNNPGYEIICPGCDTAQELSERECADMLREAEAAIKNNDYISATEIYKFLAALGIAEGERELGLILERGVLLPRDLDAATKYFYSAARRGDATAAYRYSRLCVGNRAACDFWLAYSALMGCKKAYADAFALYSTYKERSTAAYYCSLLAEEGDTDAIVEMARRHLYGDGVEQNERMAKWYMDRIGRVPLHAIKLHRRLSAVVGGALRPPIPEFTEKRRITERLIAAAKKYGYNKLLVALCHKYSEYGGADSQVFLALLHIEGIELTKNLERGVAMLEDAMERGSVLGAKCLGDLYSRGEFTERDNRLATIYYRRAAALGGRGEYENLGDIFRGGLVCEPDYALALSLYERGAEEGDGGCQRKLDLMCQEREQCYIEATRLERSSPDEAFKLYKRAVESGYIPAHARIGWYYERGIGTRVDRKAAFLHYKAAYDAGDKRDIESLGRCYARGIGVAFNFDRAAELLSIAKDMGSRSADRELYRIYENKKRHMLRSLYSTAMELYYNKKYDIAVEMLTTCMNLGLGNATYAIGCLHEFGITTAPDRAAAMRYYKRAYDQGYSDPRQYHKQSMLRIWQQNK